MNKDTERCGRCHKVVYHSWTEAEMAAASMRRFVPESSAAIPYRSPECGGGIFHVGERHAARNGRFKFVQQKRKRNKDWRMA